MSQRASGQLLMTGGGLLISIATSWCPALQADELDDCVANSQKQYEAPQSFAQPAEVTCPDGDVVGFPPRIRKNNRSAVATYTAPAGYIIENKAVQSIIIENVSQNDGSYGSPTISNDGTTVSVPIACNGKNPTEGRSWQNIVIRGTVVRNPTIEQLKNWVIQCTKCIGARNCAP
jgi:hypothetical protein